MKARDLKVGGRYRWTSGNGKQRECTFQGRSQTQRGPLYAFTCPDFVEPDDPQGRVVLTVPELRNLEIA